MPISPLRIALAAGGGALLAGWLLAATTARPEDAAVFTPAPPATPAAQDGGPPPRAAASLAADVERLRRRTADAPALRAGARNPFSLAPPPRSGAATLDPVPERARRTVPRPPRRVGPAFTLIGVASTETEGGSERSGILAAPNGDVLLVDAGDRVPGGYRVDAVDSSSVTLVDGEGARHRLDLP